MLIRYDGAKETIIPEQEPDADVMLFSFLPGLSRPASRIIADSPISLAGRANREDDQVYYRQRADQEIGMAQAAANEQAAHAHYLLAAYYLNLVHKEQAVEREPAVA